MWNGCFYSLLEKLLEKDVLFLLLEFIIFRDAGMVKDQRQDL